MRRRARIIHERGRGDFDREISDALDSDGAGDPRSVPVEITRMRRGGEYVWGFSGGGESSTDESKIRRAAQKVVDELRSAGVPAHVKVSAIAEPHGGW